MAQSDHKTHRERTIDKADHLIRHLEEMENTLCAVIAGTENLKESVELGEEPDWPDYPPSVYRQLRETVRQLQQQTQDASVRLDLERIACILAAVTDS